ncbi:galactose ABC transporter substrate-binding protein [Clostridium beijerinckii]|nr:galactose ABC transporter substrate-binding protein [Clostridium beijerinckii]
MKILKKTITLIISLVIITSILMCCNVKMINTISSIATRRQVKVGVVINNDNVFLSLISKNLDDIQKENKDNVQFTFFNGKGNSALESELLNNILQNNYDLILTDVQAPEIISESIVKAKQKNIPLIFINITPTGNQINKFKEYSESLVIKIDSEQAADLQGKMIADFWNVNKEIMDKNNDNIMQYIMIKGRRDSFESIIRTNNSLSAINNAGIKTQELASAFANWDEDLGKGVMESVFLKYAGNIEVIIANNDAMAVGAIKALQKYGYNIGDPKKTIPIFGINQTPEAKDLIKKGFMAGSVPESPRAIAEALYTVGMNLVSGINPIEGTNYKFDKSGVTIPIQSQEYISQNEKQ